MLLLFFYCTIFNTLRALHLLSFFAIVSNHIIICTSSFVFSHILQLAITYCYCLEWRMQWWPLDDGRFGKVMIFHLSLDVILCNNILPTTDNNIICNNMVLLYRISRSVDRWSVTIHDRDHLSVHDLRTIIERANFLLIYPFAPFF